MRNRSYGLLALASLVSIVAFGPHSAPGAADPSDPADEAAVRAQSFKPRLEGLRRQHRALDEGERLFVAERMLGGFAGVQREYVRFDRLPDRWQRRALQDQGLFLMDYVGNQTYVAAVDERGRVFLAQAAGITELGPIPLEHKIDAELLAGEVHRLARDEAGRVLVQIRFHQNATLQEALQVVAELPVIVLDDAGFADQRLLEAAVAEDSISSLAAADAVRNVLRQSPPPIPANAAAAALSTTDALWSPPYDLDGAGYRVGVWDLGAIHPHPEFGSRITYVNGLAFNTHATAVAGTIGAAGNLGSIDSLLAHGMATAVDISSYNQASYASEYTAAVNAGAMVLSNNSWDFQLGWEFFPACGVAQGCAPPVPAGWYMTNSPTNFGNYGGDSFNIDTAARLAETTGKTFLIVTTAGNHRDDGPGGEHDGTLLPNPNEVNPYYDTIGPTGSAKNNVTVGDVQVDNLTSAVQMTPYSGWGPTNDGRIKPDLVAKGQAVHTTFDSAFYATQSGASIAAAVVSGSAVLLIEQYEDMFGTTPTNAEVKALLVNSASDLGNPGPDYVYGYGLLQTQAAANMILNDGASSSVQSGQLNQGQTDSYALTVPAGTPSIKVTLAWIDPAGVSPPPPPPAVQLALINNLNLRLISPTGQSHFPFSLSLANPLANATTTGPNNVDTVEQVVVLDPQPGSWTVVVTAPAAPQSPQIYGLVSQNGLAAPDIFDFLPPDLLTPFPYPYRRPVLSAKYVDTGGGGIVTGAVIAYLNSFNVTAASVVTPGGVYYKPTFDLWESTFTFTVSVANTLGVQHVDAVEFRIVQAGEVQDHHVTPGGSGEMILTWGNSSHNPTQLIHQGYRIYRSTDLQQNMEWIGSTTTHTFTDNSPPTDDLVFYEVHALYDVGSGNRILSIRNTPHRTQQPFIVLPRGSAYQALPAGVTAVRFRGMSEPGSVVSIVVDGGEIGTPTTGLDGAFELLHDFGAPGAHTVYVQAKAAGESLSVPSVEVDFVIPPAP